MLTSPAQVVATAQSQLGYIEGPNNDSIFGTWLGVPNAPWCASFVSWAVWTACHANGEASPLEGVQSARGVAYVPYVVTWARDNNVWRPNPAPGFLVCFDWGRDGVGDHIGICTSGGDPYDTCEGNTAPANNSNGGEVMARTRSNSAGYSMGFVDLYGLGSTPPAPVEAVPAPAPVGPPWPGRVFVLTTPMMVGEDIRQWQAKMSDRGWSITVDGWYGPGSVALAKAFQADKGLESDGVVGPATWLATFTAPVT